jgi:5-methylcytosine-specific restriction endonuclease McrA
MLGWLRNRATELFGGQPRSSRWPKARAEAIRRQPFCIACGRSKSLEVHHIRPFSLAPDLELEQSNLTVLCGDPCHLVHGHLMDFKRHNAAVVDDCRRYRDALDRAKLAAH